VALRNVPDSFRLVPGMTLSGDIHVGTRSLFTYLIGGVVSGASQSMREP
jgi:hemolysin D